MDELSGEQVRAGTVAAARRRRLSRAAFARARQLLDPQTVSEGVEPLRITRKGNYAIGVEWSDGHRSSVYTYEQLRRVGRDQ